MNAGLTSKMSNSPSRFTTGNTASGTLCDKSKNAQDAKVHEALDSKTDCASMFDSKKPATDDLTVRITSSDGEEFCCAMSVLISASGYFRSCLRSGMKESLKKTVNFTNLNSAVLRSTLTFLKSGSFDLDLSSVKDVLFAAAYLQIPSLEDFCSAFLKREINLETCITVHKVAVGYDLPGVILSVKEFLCENFLTFSTTASFLDLSAELVCELLRSDDLNITAEKQALDALLLWLTSNKDSMHEVKGQLGELLSAVRIPCLYMESLEEIKKSLLPFDEETNGETGNAAKDSCISDFVGKLQHYQSNPQLCHKFASEPDSRVRKAAEVIVTLGGLEQGIWKKQACNKTKFALTSTLPKTEDKDLQYPTVTFMLYDKHTSRLLTKVYEHATCSLDNYIYLAGGKTLGQDRAQFATNTFYRFDPRVFEWSQLSEMNVCRSLFYLGGVSGRVYAVGGVSKVGVENTVECYAPETDTWTYMKPMLSKLHEHAGCVYEQMIYITGGHDGLEGTSAATWRFDPGRDSWKATAPLRHARSNHAMVAHGNKLYVFGGCQVLDDSPEDVWECETYDIAADQWTAVTAIPNPSCCLATISVGKSILCLGGYGFSTSKYVDMVQVYNTDEKSWKTFRLHMSTPKCFVCEKIVVNKALLFDE